MNELGLSSIFVLEGSDQKIAETVKSNTKTKDQKIVTLNSMQGVTAKDIEAGANYISIMEENLKALKEGLASVMKKIEDSGSDSSASMSSKAKSSKFLLKTVSEHPALVTSAFMFILILVFVSGHFELLGKMCGLVK